MRYSPHRVLINVPGQVTEGPRASSADGLDLSAFYEIGRVLTSDIQSLRQQLVEM